MKTVVVTTLLCFTLLFSLTNLEAKKQKQDKSKDQLKEFVLALRKAAKEREVSWFMKRTVFPAILEFECGRKLDKVSDKVFLQVILADEYREMAMAATSKKAPIIEYDSEKSGKEEKSSKIKVKSKDFFNLVPQDSKIYFISSPKLKNKLGYYVAKIDNKFKIIGVHRCDD